MLSSSTESLLLPLTLHSAPTRAESISRKSGGKKINSCHTVIKNRWRPERKTSGGSARSAKPCRGGACHSHDMCVDSTGMHAMSALGLSAILLKMLVQS